MDIIKTIIPAAGIGSRFLPYTKSVPKEMLPLGTKPALQYIVEEALAASLNNFLIITGKNKEAILNYFDDNSSLDVLLKETNREELVASVTKIIRNANFTYIRQPEPLGLGHAVWMARHSFGKEYCAIMLPDDLMIGQQSGIGQLVRIARQEKTSVIAVQEVSSDEISSYGVIGIKKQITPSLFQVSHLVEKPQPKDAPSNLAIVGRYVLSYKIFAALEQLSSYATQELQLTDGISAMLHQSERVFAYKIQGVRHDIGTPFGWLKANLMHSLQNQETAQKLQTIFKEETYGRQQKFIPAKTYEEIS